MLITITTTKALRNTGHNKNLKIQPKQQQQQKQPFIEVGSNGIFCTCIVKPQFQILGLLLFGLVGFGWSVDTGWLNGRLFALWLTHLSEKM